MVGKKVLSNLTEKVDPRVAALIVIDMQNDFCDPKGIMSKRGYDLSHVQETIPQLLNFIESARNVGLRVIFVRATYDEEYRNDPMKERTLRLRLTQVTEGTWGSSFYPGFEPKAGELVITKHRYSAFVGTDLKQTLEQQGIKTLIMSGVVTNCCVESAARDGFMLGFYIVFPKDLSGSYDRQAHEATLKNIELLFGVVASAKEILDAWKGSQGSG